MAGHENHPEQEPLQDLDAPDATDDDSVRGGSFVGGIGSALGGIIKQVAPAVLPPSGPAAPPPPPPPPPSPT